MKRESSDTVSKDVTVVGVSSKSKDLLDKWINQHIINDRIDGYKVAVSVAIKNELPLPDEDQSYTATTWNIGSLDLDQSFATVISLLTPYADRPYFYSRKLAEAGFRYFDQNGYDIDSIVDLFGSNN